MNMTDQFLSTAASVCRWLPLGRRSVFGACWSLAGRPGSFVTPVEDLWFVVDTGDLRSLQSILYGIQDQAIVAIMLDKIREGHTVVDIGANKGMLSLFLARKAGSSGRVFAYEPDPRH